MAGPESRPAGPQGGARSADRLGLDSASYELFLKAYASKRKKRRPAETGALPSARVLPRRGGGEPDCGSGTAGGQETGDPRDRGGGPDTGPAGVRGGEGGKVVILRRVAPITKQERGGGGAANEKPRAEPRASSREAFRAQAGREAEGLRGEAGARAFPSRGPRPRREEWRPYSAASAELPARAVLSSAGQGRGHSGGFPGRSENKPAHGGGGRNSRRRPGGGPDREELRVWRPGATSAAPFEGGPGREPLCYSTLPADDGVLPFRRKKAAAAILGGASWADDKYWACWDGWDEIIDWGDGEENTAEDRGPQQGLAPAEGWGETPRLSDSSQEETLPPAKDQPPPTLQEKHSESPPHRLHRVQSSGPCTVLGHRVQEHVSSDPLAVRRSQMLAF
nr:PREDICTED: translation initiation factor IF-2-like [Lepisosteus oculatus]XP_015220853.1 PREDICTED: translation initiation factor IF-2-like [Lepisosteus oculatus]